MMKRSTSKKSQLKSTSSKTKHTRLGREIIKGANQMLAHVRGEIELPSYTLPGPVDVKAIRGKTGMSQAEFASAFALNRRTLQEWEQGRMMPDSTVRAYLTVIDKNPRAVMDALR